MLDEQRKRLVWIKLYEETGDAGLVCRRCGISRPTLRKWWIRYQQSGLEGLLSQSRRPQSFSNRVVTEKIERLILSMRKNRNLGAKRISSELLRLHEIKLSPPTIQKVLNRAGKGQLPVHIRRKKLPKRYNRPIPGDRVQMDVCKIAPYHFSAIDDCTRLKVMRIFPRRTAANTIKFMRELLEELPFPIQRVQTDRGGEFFAYKVQDWLKAHSIKFRLIKPRSPHLNGKVERGHKTDLQEFYNTVDLQSEELPEWLAEWQHFYNWQRPHSSLGGKAPMDRYFELLKKIPYWDDVYGSYDPDNEPTREKNYRDELAMLKLK